MQKEKLGITGLYIHCICSTATTALDPKSVRVRVSIRVIDRVRVSARVRVWVWVSTDFGPVLLIRYLSDRCIGAYVR